MAETMNLGEELFSIKNLTNKTTENDKERYVDNKKCFINRKYTCGSKRDLDKVGIEFQHFRSLAGIAKLRQNPDLLNLTRICPGRK
jgi:hypothetical protein